MKQGYSLGGNAQCVYCTEKAIAFMGSPYSQLPFDVRIALGKGGTIVFDSFEFSQISILGPTRSE